MAFASRPIVSRTRSKVRIGLVVEAPPGAPSHHLGAGSDSRDDDRFDSDRYGQDRDAIGSQLYDVGRAAGGPQLGGAPLGYQAAGPRSSTRVAMVLRLSCSTRVSPAREVGP